MTTRNRAVLLMLLLLAATAAFAGPGKILTHKKPIPNSYVVRLEPLSSPKEVERVTRELVREYKVKLARRGQEEAIFKYALQGFSGDMTDDAALALAADPRVAVVEQNAWVGTSPTQTFSEADPHYNLDRIDQSGPVQPYNRSYSYTSTGSGVYIYILDTGVHRNHIEFDNDNDPNTPQYAPRVLDGMNFASDGYPASNPCNGYVGSYALGTHGTAVASVAGGKNVGVAKNVYIVPVRVANCFGGATLQWLCWGMDWIAGPNNPYPKRPAVTNISMFIDSANPWDTVTPISSFEHTVNNVIGAGITVVVSANNQANSNCTTSPARMAYTNAPYFGSTYRVISVGGTDEQDRLWRCLNFGDCNNATSGNPGGTDPGSNTGPCVDIYAPAHNLKVAWNSGYANYRQLPGQRSGTSFSAPAVAGIAARLLQNNPYLTPQQVWDAIRTRAVALPSNFDGDWVYANDRIAHLDWWE